MKTIVAVTLSSLAFGACADEPDTTAPTVKSVTPADRAIGVAIDTDVVLTFSEPIDPASVAAGVARLNLGTYDVPVEAAVEDGGTRLRITPRLGLGNRASYMFAAAGITDEAGNPMLAFASRFSTEAAELAADDPLGDAFGSGAARPDVAMVSAVSGDEITIGLEFSAPISRARLGAANSVGGYLDIDVDQDATTGTPGATDRFRQDGGSTGLGVDYRVILFDNDDGTLSVIADEGEGGTVVPTFTERGLTLAIPLAMLGDDDGNVDLAAVIGSLAEPTDIVPNAQSIRLGTSGLPATGRSAATSPRGPRTFAWAGR